MNAETAPPASSHALGRGIQSLEQQLGSLSVHGAGEPCHKSWILVLLLLQQLCRNPGRAGMWEDWRVAEELR